MSPVPGSRTRELLKSLVAQWCQALHELGDLLAGDATLSTAVWARDNVGAVSPLPADFNPKPLLEDLLSADAHLEATCRNPWTLARAIEINTIREIVQAAVSVENPPVDPITDLLLSHLFEDD